ncbi:MAG TPA: hypothetical protein VGF55_02270 [Gemmataceae bacterium]
MRLATVGVPTRDRVEALRRCLDSFAAPARRQPPTEFVVVDGSDRPEAGQATLRMLEQFRDRHGAAVWYAGRADVSGYAEALARHAGLPADVVRFGLLGGPGYPVTTGASRNVLLLHAAGDVLLQVDDDTVCRLRPAPGRQDGLVRAPRFDPTEFWPLPDDEPPGPPDQYDLLAVHEQLLGRDVDGGRVAATAAGVWGDPGMSSSLYLLALDGASRERLLRTEAGYRRAVRDRRLMRAVDHPTAGGGLCVALNLGLDHRTLLPPFLPVQRNQDGVFGALLRGCFENRLFGYLPWMLLHDPAAGRPDSTRGDWSRQVGVGSGQIVQAVVKALAPTTTGTDAGARLRQLGQELVRLAAAPEARFADAVRVLIAGHLGRFAAGLEERLRSHGGRPDYWAADVRQVLGLLSPEAVARLAVSPTDLAEAFGPEAALPRLRDLLTEFGRLLAVWPEMVAAARHLRAQDVRPARPV